MNENGFWVYLRREIIGIFFLENWGEKLFYFFLYNFKVDIGF